MRLIFSEYLPRYASNVRNVVIFLDTSQKIYVIQYIHTNAYIHTLFHE